MNATITVIIAIALGFVAGLPVGAYNERELHEKMTAPMSCEKQLADFEWRAIARLDEILLQLTNAKLQRNP